MHVWRVALLTSWPAGGNCEQNAEAATWKGLLQRGLHFCKDVKNWSDSSPSYISMRRNINNGKYLEAAEELSTLSPGNKRKFFGETVGQLSIKVQPANLMVGHPRIMANGIDRLGRNSSRCPSPTQHSRDDHQL
jgi:hypothetical protein